MLLRRLAGAVLLCFVTLLPAACTEPPRPFGRDGLAAGSAALPPLTGTSVAVLPVADLPPPLALAVAEALADGLAAAEVPARVTPEGGLPGEHRLLGQVLAVEPHAESDTLRLAISLELRDSDGNPVMVQTVEDRLPGALWTSQPQDADAVAAMAGRLVAPAVAALAAAERALVPVPSGEPEGLAQDGGPGTPPPPPAALAALPAVAVMTGDGAPGGGSNDAVLASAMRSVLRDVGVPQMPADSASASVAAAVALTPVPTEDQDRIRVVWTVRTPDGAEIGTIAQENLLPRGYAEQHWPDLAYLIAGAAVDGVVPLLRRLPDGS